MPNNNNGNNGNNGNNNDSGKYVWGARIAIAGFVLVFAVLLVVLVATEYTNSSDIVAIASLFTTMVGTVVGAFFGVNVAQQASEGENKTNEESKKKAEDDLARLQKQYGELNEQYKNLLANTDQTRLIELNTAGVNLGVQVPR